MKLRTGFTLLELILATALSGILIAALSQWFSVTIQTRAKIDTIREVEQYGTRIMEAITQSARNAQNISSPVPQSSGASMTLIVDDGGKSPTVFDLSSSLIRMTEGAAPARALHPPWIVASALSFQNLAAQNAPSTIKVQFTLSRDNPSGSPSFDYQQTFYGSATLRQ